MNVDNMVLKVMLMLLLLLFRTLDCVLEKFLLKRQNRGNVRYAIESTAIGNA